MLTKALASLAIIGSAAAFAPGSVLPLRAERTSAASVTMVERRDFVQAAGLAALTIATPAFADPSNTFSGKNGIAPKQQTGQLGTSIVGVGSRGAPKGKNFAPSIQVFDARGCPRGGGEYTGPSSGDMNDEMMIKVALTGVKVTEYEAAAFKRDQLGYTFPTTRFPKSE